MPRPGDRRPVITDHAIEIVAGGGARALSHQSVDRAAGLPPGSTSYYFRTRDSLISATIARIQERSRTAFLDDNPPRSPSFDEAAQFIAHHIHLLTTSRRADALAVFGLLPEIRMNAELRQQLGGCLFSLERATALIRSLGSSQPDEDAVDLIAVLTGLLFDELFGIRSQGVAPSHPIAETIAGVLHQLAHRDRR